jgi:hypothetical protein
MLNFGTLRVLYKDAILDIANLHHADNICIFVSVAHGAAKEL